MYAMLVLRYHLNPSYVLDTMTMEEIKALMKYDYYSIMDEWEQTRLIAYYIAQVNSRHRLDMKNMIPFVWEEEKHEDEEQKISKEDIERLQNKAQDYITRNGRSCN